MKKILICLLLLTNLGTGLVFALDNHSEAMAGYDSVMTDLLDDEAPSDDDLHHSDHCCHGAAHLTGLTFSQATPFVASGDGDFFRLSETPALLYIAPLLRPPIL